jgi:2-polyprenyl-3-methyl-5-hydroxy-6-metoxy-1,4-benzoquinol methylase
MTEDEDLDEQIALAMEIDPRLLPLLPELLVDLEELGGDGDDIVAALAAAGLPPGSTVLDLGCGKGAIAVALAERLDLEVDGVDGFAPFVEASRTLAASRGVAGRCRFRHGDIRRLLGTAASYDAVLLLGVGPVAGDHESTVAGLRTLVRPGGLIVVDDLYLAEGAAQPIGYDGYADLAGMRRHLTAPGCAIVGETICQAEATRAVNERNTALIRRRAHELREAHPGLAELIDAYVARQELETELLGTEHVCAIWTLRRDG